MSPRGTWRFASFWSRVKLTWIWKTNSATPVPYTCFWKRRQHCGFVLNVVTLVFFSVDKLPCICLLMPKTWRLASSWSRVKLTWIWKIKTSAAPAPYTCFCKRRRDCGFVLNVVTLVFFSVDILHCIILLLPVSWSFASSWSSVKLTWMWKTSNETHAPSSAHSQPCVTEAAKQHSKWPLHQTFASFCEVSRRRSERAIMCFGIFYVEQ